MSQDSESLKKSLNLWDATMMVAGSMIGSGIFIVSAEMSRQVGSSGWLIVLWALSGIITLIAALCYGELAGMFPQAGGQFVYIHRAYGKLPSFLYGWTVFTVIQTGVIAAVAVAFARYTAVFVPAIGPEHPVLSVGSFIINRTQLFAILSIVFLTWMNSRGVNTGKWIQDIFTSSKIIALLLLIAAGLWIGSGSGWLKQNFQDAFSAASLSAGENGLMMEPLTGMALMIALGTAIIGSLFSSDAWNNVTFIAGEIQNPKSNIPRSLMLGTGIVTVLYILANISYLSLLPLKGHPEGVTVIEKGIAFATNDRVGTAAAEQILGNHSVLVMAALIMISTFGCNNGIILAGARVYYAMAQTGLFFKQTTRLNRYQVPANALWIQAAWASVLCLTGSYSQLLEYTTFASLLFYMVTIYGIFILRKTLPDEPRPYKVPLFPVLPILYFLMAGAICLVLLYNKPFSTWSGLLIVALGIPVYYLSGLNRNKPTT
jgi:basic amino acid/polyamine antiporter, APA family